jgi:esterase/lipase
MRPLGELLQRQRLTTGIVELTGHGDGTMRPIGGFETWVEDVRAAARAAAERYPSTPLTVLGFSLGGAVALGALDDGMMPPVAKLVLIAPAVTLKGYPAPLRVISWFGVFGLAVPSVIPRTYRSSATTPLAYYAHLFRLIEHLLTKPHTAAWGRVSALVISSRGDEFVSHRRWDRYVRELGVRHWEHLILPPADTGLPGHLLLDEPSFGAENWNVVSARLIDFLTAP